MNAPVSFGPATRQLTQDLTYWAPGARDKFGERGFSAPVLLKGRWKESNELVMNSQGEEITSGTQARVPSDVVEGGQIALGDYTEQADPSLVPGALEIKVFKKTPDLRVANWSRRAMM